MVQISAIQSAIDLNPERLESLRRQAAEEQGATFTFQGTKIGKTAGGLVDISTGTILNLGQQAPRVTREPFEAERRTLLEKQISTVGVAPAAGDIRERLLSQAQERINAIRESFVGRIAEARERGEVGEARTRAETISFGLAGGARAGARAREAEDVTAKLVEQKTKERDLTISNILAEVEQRATTEFQVEREGFLERVKESREAIEEFQEVQRERATTNIASFAQAGLSFDEFKRDNPDTFLQLQDEGLTEQNIKAIFISNQPEQDIILEEVIGNQLIQVVVDPITGEKKQTTFELDLPEEVKGLKVIGKQPNGQILLAPEGFTSPDQIVIVGAAKEEKITPEEGTAGATFTSTQISKGATSANMSIEEFRKLSEDDANRFITGGVVRIDDAEAQDIITNQILVDENGKRRSQEDIQQIIDGGGVDTADGFIEFTPAQIELIKQGLGEEGGGLGARFLEQAKKFVGIGLPGGSIITPFK